MLLCFLLSETLPFGAGDKMWTAELNKGDCEENSKGEAGHGGSDWGLGGGLQGKLHERGEQLILGGWGRFRPMETGVESMKGHSPRKELQEQRPGEKTAWGIFRGC